MKYTKTDIELIMKKIEERFEQRKGDLTLWAFVDMGTMMEIIKQTQGETNEK